jgi:hypothetical protein
MSIVTTFDSAALQEMISIRKEQRRIAGTITHGYAKQLMHRGDALRRQLKVMSVGDSIDHQLEVEISGEPCRCRTCLFERMVTLASR